MVDDVGSSPGCLAVLPLVCADVVKLDMRMRRHEEPGDFAPAVGPLLRYVETSGATLVGKGIESDADMQLARALGATVGQGYRLGAPEPLRPAESRTDADESSSWTRSRWGLLRD